LNFLSFSISDRLSFGSSLEMAFKGFANILDSTDSLRNHLVVGIVKRSIGHIRLLENHVEHFTDALVVRVLEVALVVILENDFDNVVAGQILVAIDPVDFAEHNLVL